LTSFGKDGQRVECDIQNVHTLLCHQKKDKYPHRKIDTDYKQAVSKRKAANNQ
jgi:hypothetical protein